MLTASGNLFSYMSDARETANGSSLGNTHISEDVEMLLNTNICHVVSTSCTRSHIATTMQKKSPTRKNNTKTTYVALDTGCSLTSCVLQANVSLT